MKVDKQNNFEEEWRKAFDGASMTPSDELWGRIESELEKKKSRPFLFFLKPSLMATGLAAALALVLGGILFFNQEPKADIAQNKGNYTPTTAFQDSREKSPVNATTSNDSPAIAANIKESKTKGVNRPVLNNTGSITAITSKASPSSRLSENTIALNVPPAETGKASINGLANSINEKTLPATTKTLIASAETLGSVDKLDGKKYRYLGSRYTMQRNKLAFDAEAIEEPDNTTLASNDSKFWVGLQSGVAPFDPNMKLGGINSMAYSAANSYAQMANGSIGAIGPGAGDKGSLTVSQPQNNVKSGLAINSGVAFGYKVASKWHIESGVKYLRGNSTLETNTYSFQNNGYVNTFLGNYLMQNSAQNNNYSMTNKSNTVVSDASQFGNRYEYLMIPMQMGYEIELTKRLDLNLLAGFSTDIFLQNSIFTDKGLVKGKNTINSDNRIYKPVNFSGLGGVRASYMLNKHWQANIGTSYQRALFSGMTSAVNINMQLQMFGINYGFNYRF